MPHRAKSRSLLSLLMIWQLLASVLAHPVGIPAAVVQVETPMQMTGEMTEQDDCPHAASHDHAGMMQMEHLSAPTQTEHSDSQLAGYVADHQHSCQSACKCPCAGTPALASGLPMMLSVMPDHVAGVPGFTNVASPPIANLLRPPIV